MPANTICGWGYAVAATPISNAGLLTPDRHERDLLRETGVCTRYRATLHETPATLGAVAARAALASAQVAAGDLAAIIAVTTLGDYLEVPPTACLIQREIGAAPVASFSITGGSSQFCTALMVGHALLATQPRGQPVRSVLIVGTVTTSRFLRLDDVVGRAQFGDAAGAVVLGSPRRGHTLIGVAPATTAGHPQAASIPAGGSRLPASHETVSLGLHALHRDLDPAILESAADAAVAAAERLCTAKGIPLGQVNRVIPNTPQPTVLNRLKRAFTDRGLAAERIYCPLGRFGDVWGASLPLAVADTAQRGLFNPGEVILLVAAEPAQCGAALLSW